MLLENGTHSPGLSFMGTVLKAFFRPPGPASLFLSLVLSVSSQGADAPAPPNTNHLQLKRYLVFSDAEAARAVASGAKVVRVTKGLKAVACPPALGAALGLMEDIPVQATDSAANAQVLATRAQDLGLTGRGRKIVVLDTGYNYNHPELASSYLGGTNFVNDNGDPFDNNGHGSHVAGIITGDGVDPRAKGIAPETGIIAGKVLDANGLGYISDLVAGIYWAVDGPDGYFGTADDFQADAINISIGTRGTDTYPSVFCDAAVPAMTDAIRYARDHGVVVVIAAGNNGVSGVSLPGCVSYSVTVGAIDRSNVITSFSGTGPAVDLVAPGVGLYSAWLGAAYKSLDGTSQAAPPGHRRNCTVPRGFSERVGRRRGTRIVDECGGLGIFGKGQSLRLGRVPGHRGFGFAHRQPGKHFHDVHEVQRPVDNFLARQPAGLSPPGKPANGGCGDRVVLPYQRDHLHRKSEHRDVHHAGEQSVLSIMFSTVMNCVAADVRRL